jgi:hypothetical protein
MQEGVDSNMGRLLVPADGLIEHIDYMQQADSQRHFAMMSAVRYASIGGVVFMCYMVPHLASIYNGLNGVY